MKEKINYYLIKVISVIVLLFSLCQIFFWIGLLTISLAGAPLGHIESGILFMFVLVAVSIVALYVFIGALGFYGSLGLFFFKKFGYYLTLASIILFLLPVPGISSFYIFPFSWMYLIDVVLIIFIIYLLIQKKNIEKFQNRNAVEVKKIILISSVVLFLMCGAFIYIISHNKDTINQHLMDYFPEHFSNGRPVQGK